MRKRYRLVGQHKMAPDNPPGVKLTKIQQTTINQWQRMQKHQNGREWMEHLTEEVKARIKPSAISVIRPTVRRIL